MTMNYGLLLAYVTVRCLNVTSFCESCGSTVQRWTIPAVHCGWNWTDWTAANTESMLSVYSVWTFAIMWAS